jgi:hypothetical protein
MQRKSHLCIPFLCIARPQSQFPHSCACEGFIYSQDRPTYFLQQNRQIDRIVGIYKSMPFLGIIVSTFSIGSLQCTVEEVIEMKGCQLALYDGGWLPESSPSADRRCGVPAAWPPPPPVGPSQSPPLSPRRRPNPPPLPEKIITCSNDIVYMAYLH